MGFRRERAAAGLGPSGLNNSEKWDIGHLFALGSAVQFCCFLLFEKQILLTLSSLKTATAVERIFPFIPENL